MGYRLLPVSDLPNVDFPTIQVKASLPGASPETMASAVATPLEKQFSTIAGVDVDQLDQRARAARTSRCSSTSTATSTPPRRTCRRRSRARRAQLPPGMPSPPSYQKVNPADSPILFLALSSPTLPLSQVERVRRDDAGAAHLDGQRRRAGERLRRAEVRRARRGRPDAAGRAADRHRRGRAGRSARQRQPADRHALRADSAASPCRRTGS